MPVWFLSRRVESCEFPLRGRSSVGEHLLCKQGVVGSNPTVSMGDGCGLRAMSFPGFQENRSSFVLWSFEGARCGLEVLFFLMVKMNWCVVTHHKCQRVCLRADVMRGAAVR